MTAQISMGIPQVGVSQTKLAQQKLDEARTLLLCPSPASLDSSYTLLGEVAHILEELIEGGPGGLTSDLVASVREIQHSARELQDQIQHGSRFCLGWLQARMGTGYTNRGVPIMMESAGGRSFEL